MIKDLVNWARYLNSEFVYLFFLKTTLLNNLFNITGNTLNTLSTGSTYSAFVKVNFSTENKNWQNNTIVKIFTKIPCIFM